MKYYDEMTRAEQRKVGFRILKQYAGRVSAGTRYLNRTLPTWAKKVTLTDLELSSGRNCVLGQCAARSAVTSAGFEMGGGACPDFGDAVVALDIKDQIADLGFIADDHIEDAWNWGQASCNRPGYWALNHLWTAAIRLTRKGEKVTVRSLLATVRF